jgi:hypothetical protein
VGAPIIVGETALHVFTFTAREDRNAVVSRLPERHRVITELKEGIDRKPLVGAFGLLKA